MHEKTSQITKRLLSFLAILPLLFLVNIANAADTIPPKDGAKAESTIVVKATIPGEEAFQFRPLNLKEGDTTFQLEVDLTTRKIKAVQKDIHFMHTGYVPASRALKLTYTGDKEISSGSGGARIPLKVKIASGPNKGQELGATAKDIVPKPATGKKGDWKNVKININAANPDGSYQAGDYRGEVILTFEVGA